MVAKLRDGFTHLLAAQGDFFGFADILRKALSLFRMPCSAVLRLRVSANQSPRSSDLAWWILLYEGRNC